MNSGQTQYKYIGLLLSRCYHCSSASLAVRGWTLSVPRTKVFVPFTWEVVQLLIHSNASSSPVSVCFCVYLTLSPSWLEFDLRVLSLQRAEVLIGSQDNFSPPTVILCWNQVDWHWEGQPGVSLTICVYSCVQNVLWKPMRHTFTEDLTWVSWMWTQDHILTH